MSALDVGPATTPELIARLITLDSTWTAGLVTGRLELSDDGKAMKFFEVTPFAIHLTPELVVEAARTLDESELETPSEKEGKP